MFADRIDAGRRLGRRLGRLAGDEVVVLGLPRGGVPVAAEVAAAIGAPLDVIVVRKLGVPFQPELAMGAIGEDGARVIDEEVMSRAQVTPDELAEVEERERAELARRCRRFRRCRPRLDLAGKTALIVDDGIATASTARAACHVARAQGAERVVVAAPVAPPDVATRLAGVADQVIVLTTPASFRGVGQFYLDFSQASDDDVVELLAASRVAAPAACDDDGPLLDEEVSVPVGALLLPGQLRVPAEPRGVVVFAHGSGSSRHSPRNRHVASVLNDGGLATLLVDLLTADEELDRVNVFDVELLAGRLATATWWVRSLAGLGLAEVPVGYFGASTGAAAALWAAAEGGSGVTAVVARGGRPDLAGAKLTAVTAPTLLIVGGDDTAVLKLNEEARHRLGGESELEVVPGASHLFEEPGALDRVAELALGWFATRLARPSTPER